MEFQNSRLTENEGMNGMSRKTFPIEIAMSNIMNYFPHIFKAAF